MSIYQEHLRCQSPLLPRCPNHTLLDPESCHHVNCTRIGYSDISTTTSQRAASKTSTLPIPASKPCSSSASSQIVFSSRARSSNANELAQKARTLKQVAPKVYMYLVRAWRAIRHAIPTPVGGVYIHMGGTYHGSYCNSLHQHNVLCPANQRLPLNIAPSHGAGSRVVFASVPALVRFVC